MFRRVPNEFKVGVIATLAIVLAILGYNFLRGKNIFSHEGIFYAKYDHVSGLALAGHVRYNGMNVGRVQGMNLDQKNKGQIIVSMNVSPELQIPRNSVARIVQIDLFGTKAIQIELAKGNELLKSGDTLQSDIEVDVISGVKAQASQLLGSLDSVVTTVKQTFNEDTKKNLQKSFASIQNTLDNLDKTISSNQSRLGHIIANVESITNNLNQNKDQITSILTNFNAVSDSLRKADISQTISSARDALAEVSNVMKKINDGTGSVGMLVNDSRLYNHLDSASNSLDALLRDFKDHPAHYVHFSVFGGKDKTQSETQK